jgi:hypothetical protein
MNIFVLDFDPIKAAAYHCNKHVNKMVVESAQMLCTAHRMLDGKKEKRPSNTGKREVQYWALDNPKMESLLYRAVHIKHPCTEWTRLSADNYLWHYELFLRLGEEYTKRYKREHLTIQLLKDVLAKCPINIKNIGRTPFALAMGEERAICEVKDDPVESYRNFYLTKRHRFKMDWPDKPPQWFTDKIQDPTLCL